MREAFRVRTVAKAVVFCKHRMVEEYYWIQFLYEQYESPLGREFDEQAPILHPLCVPGSTEYLLAFNDFYWMRRSLINCV